MVGRNKRYIFWFWLLNLTLAEFGVSAFRNQAHGILDHSLEAQKLVQGFDVTTFAELLTRPEFGSTAGFALPAVYFVTLFLAATILFLPGVYEGFASNYRLPREDFFRACGKNLWRYVRLLIITALIMGIVAGVLFGIRGALVKAATEGTDELLPFRIGLIMQLLIVVVMTILRSAFDLAAADVVLNNQAAVRRSVGAGLRHAFRSIFQLTTRYLAIWLVAVLSTVAGLWVWNKMVPPASVLGAFVVGQIVLIITLTARFWQRGVAVAYWQEKMSAPVVRPVVPISPIPAPLVFEPPLPVPPATQEG